MKNKGQVRLFQILQKEILFLSYDNQALLGVILQCGFPPCTLQLGQEQNIHGHSIERRAY